MKMTANETNTLKAMVEGYEGVEELNNIYNRLEWDTPKNIRLSSYQKELLYAYFVEDKDSTSYGYDLIVKVLGNKYMSLYK